MNDSAAPSDEARTAFFFFHNTGLQNQSVLFKQREGEAADKAEVLLDPNTLAADGTAALGTYSISDDGEKLAFGITRSGSDWTTVEVMDVESKKWSDVDKLEWVKFSGLSWTLDGKGFDSRYPQPKEFSEKEDKDFKRGTETSSLKNHTVYYHTLGTPQSQDILVHATPEHPDWILGHDVSEDGKWLILTISESCDPKNRVYFAPLNEDNSFSPAVLQRIVKLVVCV